MRAGLVLVLATAVAHANGRPPLTNGITFEPGDPHSLYVATTFGLLVSHDDGCTMSWVCEANIGYGGMWDPKYAIATDGTIFATTFTGLRVSRDAGCSFSTATAALPAGDPNRIADMWIDGLDIGPTGEVWVATAQSGQLNDVFMSHDNGVTFAPRGLQSSTILWSSAKVAPSDATRIYVTGYEFATPTPHLFRTDNSGGAWHASPLTNVQVGATAVTRIAAVDPTNSALVYLISEGAAGSGDKLYRSTDAGDTWTEVLATSQGPIGNVVIEDAQTVFVTTLVSGMSLSGGPAYRSTTAGVSFDPMPWAPQLACLGIAPGGDMIGCAANWDPDFEAVARSSDSALSFSKVWRFVEIAGPLKCPAGTAERDTCDQQLWPTLKMQFGATGPTCGANIVDLGAEPMPPTRTGCCDANGGGPLGLAWACGLALWLVRPRRSVRR